VLPAHLADRVTHLAEGLVAGLDVLKSPGRFLGVAAWSLFLWLVNAAAFAVCFRAFGLPVPPEGALVLQGVIGFGVALPSSPGCDHREESGFTRRELADELVVARTAGGGGGGGSALTVHGPELGPPEQNLAVRAARAILEATGHKFGVALELTKRIPVRSGL